MGSTKYDKLVRDKIPEIISSKGLNPVIEYLNDEAYLKKLNEKLGEELSEYTNDNNIEELADLVEVVYAILEHKNVTLEKFEEIRKDKASKRGGFKNKILLKEVIE